MSALSTRHPMYWDDYDHGYYPMPQAGVDYVESPPRSCLYVPQQRFWNLDSEGRPRRGADERIALYRLLGKEGLLYVGIGMHPEQRWQDHKHNKPWWRDVLVKTVDWHECRDDALVAEYLAIRHERPRCNVSRLYPRRWCYEAYQARQQISERWK